MTPQGEIPQVDAIPGVALILCSVHFFSVECAAISQTHPQLLHVDRAGHPSVSSFFNTDDTKEEYNACEPVPEF